MLEFHETSSFGDCGGGGRRDFLRIGAAGLAGLGLPMLAGGASLANDGVHGFRGKAVVQLFLCGGASHIETFDPKPDAPVGTRSVTGSIATSVPGVQFGSTYPELAKRAEKLAVVRSYAPHGISDHARAIKHTLTTGDAEGTSIGARFARFRGTSHPVTGMPSYATLIEPNEPDSQYQEDRERMRVGSRPGGLGGAYQPFDPGVGGDLASNMKLRLPTSRLDDRRSLLDSLDRIRRETDRATFDALDEYERQAFDVLLGGDVRKALDLSHESPEVVSRYDTSHMQVGWTSKRSSTLGRRMLVARRLVQAGCGFVTVGSAGWDNHANGKHPNVFDGMHLLGRPLDHAVAAFLDDLERLGMSDDVLLVVTSEFGRTPRVGKNGGRDHWPGLCPLVLAGGGLRGGQVVGQSTKFAEEPKSRKLGYRDYLGTLWHTLYDVGQLRLKPGLPTELLDELERCRPIRELV